MSTDIFQLYASYYNLLYKDKDYKAEAEYIESLIKNHSGIPVSTILNLGCGTGNHDFLFADKGYKVTGVDLSENMIKIANQKAIMDKKTNIEFIRCDIRCLDIKKKFDVVLSLFHVMSYQTENPALDKAFETASKHLKPQGLFIFDCWYGPGVLTDRPEIKNKIIEDDSHKITRVSTPLLLPNENCVEVKFDITVFDKSTFQTNNINEEHKMRYLFLPELKNHLSKAGFSVINAQEWLTGKELTFNSWNATIVCEIRALA